MAQHQCGAEAEGHAHEFDPGQGQQVQPVGHRRRGDQGCDDVRDHGRDDQPPDLRRALGRVKVALLLEEEDGIRRLEGILCPALKSRLPSRPFRSVSTGSLVWSRPQFSRRISWLTPSMIISGLPIDLAYSHDVGRAALAPRGISVPDGEKHVRAIDRLDAAIEVALLPVAALVVDDAHVVRGGQRHFHVCPLDGREVTGKFRARHRQDGMPGQADVARLLREQLVAAIRDRGQRDPLAGDLRCAGPPAASRMAPGRFRRIGELPVTGEPHDM